MQGIHIVYKGVTGNLRIFTKMDKVVFDRHDHIVENFVIVAVPEFDAAASLRYRELFFRFNTVALNEIAV